jgi:hypothetical protein
MYHLYRRLNAYGGCNAYGESGSDSVERARETALTSKEGSRRETYPMGTP